MQRYSDFNLPKKPKNGLIGNKINPHRILNCEIVVEAYEIGPSKFEGKGQRLDMQFTLNGERHIIFSSSKYLMYDLENIPKNGFPFTTTIVKDEVGRFEFK